MTKHDSVSSNIFATGHMRLGGWTRLFIVFAILWTLAVSGVVVTFFVSAKAQRLERLEQFERRAAKERADEEQRLIEEAELEQRLARGEISQDKRDALRRFDAALRARTYTPAESAAEKTPKTLSASKQTLAVASIWLLPLAGLFALGHAVGWIIRGFRQPKSLPLG